MSAYDMWLDPPDDDVEPFEAEPDAAPDDFQIGNYRSDEREIMLERRY